MILVTGATGTIGGAVVRQLAGRGERVRAFTRNPQAARMPDEVEVVRGDYTDPPSVAAAMAGARAVFLVNVPAPGRPDTDAALVAAARSAGVSRLVKLSAIGTGDPALRDFANWHVPGERAVRESGTTWTILRPSAFASNTLAWAEAIRTGEPVPIRTGTGRQGVIDPRDIAAVAVEALLSAEHAGQVYTLTGSEALSEPDQAGVLATELGRPVALAPLSREAVLAHLRARGMSEEYIEVVMRGSEFIRDGGNTTVTDDVRRVLGRAPRTYAQWVRDHLAAFTDENGGAFAT
ncbi:NAD(P)H-binding protein [Nocardia miyunensis]|uniref:NAD(P)H-binding protein n=1 Tax=Nocardia miyunensis TaxID=282684 RepID=UPI00083015EB|nr:NAD(P)H-binding protein [Nocardia miyunensis]